MKLADLIATVAQYSRNDHEVGLVVADLISRGVVRFLGHQYSRRKVR
jgi:hypothetical protein